MGEVLLDKCPDCDVTGPAVYVAAEHPIRCGWMMDNLHRCSPHDELLQPHETECPRPDVPEDADDPHGRLSG